MGLTTALIYTPATFATTEEPIELAKVSQAGGMYISHMRSEGNRLLEAINEMITIAKQANIRAEIYHLKAGGRSNWGKLDAAIAKIEAARTSGVEMTADVYTYTAASTGLDAAMPPWVQEGGYEAWAAVARS
jgi:N-acyl-D-aspartate/D-glutamate deacylase